MGNQQSQPSAESEEIEILPDEEKVSLDATKKIKKLRDDLKKCEADRKEYLNGWQRAKADYINYKNEEARRLEDIARYAMRSMIEDLLPVLDSFYLAIGHGLPKDAEQGILLIRSQLEDVLKRRGIERIDARPGDTFDPTIHESIGEVASNHPEGTIAEEVQKGYRLKGQVIRPARVRIGKSTNR